MAPKKGSKRVPKVRTPLTMNRVSAQRVQDKRTMAEYRQQRVERDAEQRYFDQLVQEAWDAWVDAGRPTDWLEMPGTFMTVPADQVETLKWRIGKSRAHYDFKIRYGRTEMVKDDQGDDYAQVVFVVSDRPKGEPKPEDGDEDDSDGSEDEEGSDNAAGLSDAV